MYKRQLNSFTPGTDVLMADGTTKPIEDVEVGDQVLATDPETGETGAKTVTHLITGEGDKNLVKISVDIDGDRGDETADITATDGHPFWVEKLDRWVDAGDLEAGMWLRTSAGAYVQVDAISEWTAQQRVHNLTVDDLHTYYVSAGETPVLVHNTHPCFPGVEVRVNSGGLATDAFNHRKNSKLGPFGRNVAVAIVAPSGRPVYGISQGDPRHSEDMILAQLRKGETITALYSERQVCPRCMSRLGPRMAPDAQVSWSVPWGDPDTELGDLINKQSNERLTEMLSKHFGMP